MITIALPKGRLAQQTVELLKKVSLVDIDISDESRKLVMEDDKSSLRFLMVKPFDVPTYVEYGVADIGVVGMDVLLERNSDVLNLLDLKLGICRVSVAKPKVKHFNWENGLRVGTKFPNISKKYFECKGINVDTIKLEGSVELAPITGISDVIVDIVSSGETLRKNGLEEIEKICDISSYLIMNRTFFKTRFTEACILVQKIKGAVG